ncbi:hypothetical protein [Marinilabilia sp.]|uniref:hypothetical protein n=1 Tax=Marinilabilia sp. TaxID=2021252 RepID=UPI0025C3B18A|nr:hypothetical protein [Marinilabilia sp.]
MLSLLSFSESCSALVRLLWDSYKVGEESENSRRSPEAGTTKDRSGVLKRMGKVDKIYLENTNLIYTLASENVNTGNVRETFFFN